MILNQSTVKPVLKAVTQKKTSKYVFKTDNCLMQVKVLYNVLMEHSEKLSTCTKVSPVLKTFVLSILSGRFRQVSLLKYVVLHDLLPVIGNNPFSMVFLIQ